MYMLKGLRQRGNRCGKDISNFMFVWTTNTNSHVQNYKGMIYSVELSRLVYSDY